MHFIHLNQHKGLFKDEASYQEFVAIFQQACGNGGLPMVLDDTDEVLFTAISPDCAKEILCNRILERMGENPRLVDELMDRLENDPIVD